MDQDVFAEEMISVVDGEAEAPTTIAGVTSADRAILLAKHVDTVYQYFGLSHHPDRAIALTNIFFSSPALVALMFSPELSG